MPGPEFFGKLGLFVLRDFLDPACCARLRSEMFEAASSKGRIFAKTQKFEVDESVRRVLCSNVSKSTELLVKSQLAQLKPKIEEHFQTSLTGCDGPLFLRYGPHDFYKPHRDVERASPAEDRKRRVSMIVFLNAAAENSTAEDCYGGGALTFYDLIKGAQWEKCGFSLDAAPGLLVAFRSNVLHEVSLITFGQRFTIAAWFTGESSRQSSGYKQRSALLKGRAQVRRRNRAANDNVKTTKAQKR